MTTEPTGHLPEVVRWSEYVDGMVISPTGYFVTYADHVAAMEAQERQLRDDYVQARDGSEPPAGTPVWWDNLWWMKRVWSDGPDRMYYASDSMRKPRAWSDMPGAVPAATPGGDDE